MIVAVVVVILRVLSIVATAAATAAAAAQKSATAVLIDFRQKATEDSQHDTPAKRRQDTLTREQQQQ